MTHRIYEFSRYPFRAAFGFSRAGTILRKGVHPEGGDTEYWEDWAKDVTGDGTPLNEFAGVGWWMPCFLVTAM